MRKYQIDGFIASQIVTVSCETNLFELFKTVILNELHSDISSFDLYESDEAERLSEIAHEYVTLVNASTDINDLRKHFDIYKIN